VLFYYIKAKIKSQLFFEKNRRNRHLHNFLGRKENEFVEYGQFFEINCPYSRSERELQGKRGYDIIK
jgi:hypothetical protein